MHCTVYCMMLESERHKEKEAICFCPGLIGYICCDGFILKEFSVSVEECVGWLVYMRDTATVSKKCSPPLKAQVQYCKVFTEKKSSH